MIKNNFKKYRDKNSVNSPISGAKNRISKLMETRMDLMFIRKLKEDGKPVIDDPAIRFNLMYDHERDKYFEEKEKAKIVQKKVGPRELLNPRKFNKKDESGNFNHIKFRNKLLDQIGNNYRMPPT